MQLGKIIGTVVATVKDKSLKDMKMLVMQPLNENLQPVGEPIVAIDVVQAGYGDIVHWVTAREASLALPEPFAPVDAAITGIVDDVNVEKNEIENKESIFGSKK